MLRVLGPQDASTEEMWERRGAHKWREQDAGSTRMLERSTYSLRVAKGLDAEGQR